MDLHLPKALKHDDGDEKKSSPAPSTTNQAAHHISFINQIGEALSEAIISDEPKDQPHSPPHVQSEHKDALHKISSLVHGEQSVQPPPHPPQPKHESILEKIGHAIGHGENPTAQPPPQQPDHNSILHKIGSALHGEEPVQPPPPPKPKHESLIDKLGHVLGHKDDTPPLPPPPPKHESVLDKLTGALSGEASPASAPAPETKKSDHVGLLGRISGAIHAGKPQEPATPQGLGDKINNALGGGAKGESKEDALDKAIDLVQEHILRQGPQDNESALEQAKDKKIADTIRDQYQKHTGSEFPIKEKK